MTDEEIKALIFRQYDAYASDSGNLHEFCIELRSKIQLLESKFFEISSSIQVHSELIKKMNDYLVEKGI